MGVDNDSQRQHCKEFLSLLTGNVKQCYDQNANQQQGYFLVAKEDCCCVGNSASLPDHSNVLSYQLLTVYNVVISSSSYKRHKTVNSDYEQSWFS